MNIRCHRIRPALFLLLGAALAGCAGTGVRVDQEAGADLSRCNRFAWMGQSNDPASLTDQRIRDAALETMRAKGYTVVEREAVATGMITVSAAARRLVKADATRKGHPLEIARIAGIQAAKRTWELVPLCHLLALDGVDVTFEFLDERTLGIQAEARATARTGVEMEALTAVAVAALTVYDMCKSLDRVMAIDQVRLEEKAGGRSGHFVRP